MDVWNMAKRPKPNTDCEGSQAIWLGFTVLILCCIPFEQWGWSGQFPSTCMSEFYLQLFNNLLSHSSLLGTHNTSGIVSAVQHNNSSTWIDLFKCQGLIVTAGLVLSTLCINYISPYLDIYITSHWLLLVV